MTHRLNDEEFADLSSILEKELGLSIKYLLRETIENRLGIRLRELKLDTFSEYLDYLRRSASFKQERTFLPSCILNMESYFLREKPQFDVLCKLLRQANTGATAGKVRVIRVLSAGCASGEEPFSMAIAVRENGLSFTECNIQITGMDIDAAALEKARHGIYHAYSLRGVDKSIIERYFRQMSRDFFRLSDDIKGQVAFRQANFLGPSPFEEESFDIAFCRNLLLYMNDDATAKITLNLWKSLKAGGRLFLGQSERLSNQGNLFEAEKFPGVTVYRKKSV